MPYKAKLKNPSPMPREKTCYKVNNWPEYNQSLKKRGKLSLYFPKGDLVCQFINDTPYQLGFSGQSQTYKEPYIELIYTFYKLFGWGLRQMTGYFEDLWQGKGLDIPVPSFGHLSDLFSSLPVVVKQFCGTLARKLSAGEDLCLIFDSTGLRFDKASDWYHRKYDKPCSQKPWRKLHFSLMPGAGLQGVDVTLSTTDDREVMEDLIPDSLAENLTKVLADGGYYSIEKVEELYQKGITPVIPPPSTAVVHGKETTTWHDKIVAYIEEKKTVYAFHKKYGYGLRSLVEAEISRLKRCLGDSFQTQKLESQKKEGIIMANILNRWNSFGRCQAVKAG